MTQGQEVELLTSPREKRQSTKREGGKCKDCVVQERNERRALRTYVYSSTSSHEKEEMWGYGD